MNRMLTALALSGLFVAGPAFANSTHAKTTHQGRRPTAVAKASDKTAVAGDKGEMKPEAGSEGAADAAKPVKAKHTKKSKKAKKTEGAPAEAPAAAPAK